MTETYWVDTSVLLRLVTGDPAPMAERATRFLERAERAEIRLRVHPLVVAETIFTLLSFYKHSKADVAGAWTLLLNAHVLELDEEASVRDAIVRMVEQNVSFTDAFTAARARLGSEQVVNFDRDFRKLDVAWLTPP